MAVMCSRRGFLLSGAVALTGLALPGCAGKKAGHTISRGSSVTEFATKLPRPAELQRRCRVVAMLDALVEGHPLGKNDTGVLYQPNWRHGDDLVKEWDGGGNNWSIIFSAEHGVFIRGFDHESDMSSYNDDDYWPGLVGALPEPFRSDLKNPDLYDHYDGALQMTVCVWRGPTDTMWRYGKVEPTQWGYYGDGGEGMFEQLVDWRPREQLDWRYPAEGHEIPDEAVRRVMDQAPLTDDLIRAFHPSPDIAALRAVAVRIGY